MAWDGQEDPISKSYELQNKRKARCQWLMPVILATQVADTGRMAV
jgi:hypothetical protein